MRPMDNKRFDAAIASAECDIGFSDVFTDIGFIDDACDTGASCDTQGYYCYWHNV